MSLCVSATEGPHKLPLGISFSSRGTTNNSKVHRLCLCVRAIDGPHKLPHGISFSSRSTTSKSNVLSPSFIFHFLISSLGFAIKVQVRAQAKMYLIPMQVGLRLYPACLPKLHPLLLPFSSLFFTSTCWLSFQDIEQFT